MSLWFFFNLMTWGLINFDLKKYDSDQTDGLKASQKRSMLIAKNNLKGLKAVHENYFTNTAVNVNLHVCFLQIFEYWQLQQQLVVEIVEPLGALLAGMSLTTNHYRIC